MRQALALLTLLVAACSPPLTIDRGDPVRKSIASSSAHAAARLPPSAWAAKPTSDQIVDCQPTSTDIRNGTAILRCRVARSGGLEACDATSTGDARLKDWALCLAPSFRSRPEHAGELIELPLTWTTHD